VGATAWGGPVAGAAVSAASSLLTGALADKGLAASPDDLANQAQQETQIFNQDIQAEITKIKGQYTTYSASIDGLYGPDSAMRNSSSDWYLPMAELGLTATKDIRTYDTNITSAESDYNDLLAQSKQNIYQLNILKTQVDKIVKGAQLRFCQALLCTQTITANYCGAPAQTNFGGFSCSFVNAAGVTSNTPFNGQACKTKVITTGLPDPFLNIQNVNIDPGTVATIGSKNFGFSNVPNTTANAYTGGVATIAGNNLDCKISLVASSPVKNYSSIGGAYKTTLTWIPNNNCTNSVQLKEDTGTDAGTYFDVSFLSNHTQIQSLDSTTTYTIKTKDAVTGNDVTASVTVTI